VGELLVRRAYAVGSDPAGVARALVAQLASPQLKIAFVFAHCRLDPQVLVAELGALAAPVVGCSALSVIGAIRPPGSREPAAVALGLYGDWVRAGVGVATELSKAALIRGRDAVHQAARGIALTADALDPGRHVAITLFDGKSNHEEAFCISSAAAAPQIRFVGGGASTYEVDVKTYVWADGAVHSDAAVVVVLESELPFHAVSSSHLEPTELITVVTSATGRSIDELDGRPAARRLRQLVNGIGDSLDEPRPLQAFARYIHGVPYVRSMHRIDGDRLVLASAVETGHILHVMRPGDLVGIMRRDLGVAAERVGGTMAAFLAFSCIGRHSEAALRGRKDELSAAFSAHPTVGFQSLSEQSGMLLVNYTLTGLAIGERSATMGSGDPAGSAGGQALRGIGARRS